MPDTVLDPLHYLIESSLQSLKIGTIIIPIRKQCQRGEPVSTRIMDKG